jgi:hypothetical protein
MDSKSLKLLSKVKDRDRIVKCYTRVLELLKELNIDEGDKATKIYKNNQDIVKEISNTLKTFAGLDHYDELKPYVDHLVRAQAFNPGSVDDMRRWLFDVKGHTPIKSTSRKEQGIPSMDWSKVETMSPEQRKDILPSTDKQSLQVFSEKDDILKELLDYKAIANLTKSFLRAADVDEEGNVVAENGLHYWVCDDDRIRPSFSTTETNRPRSFNPNMLNLPAYVAQNIQRSVESVLPEHKGKVPSIRSCVTAPKGWVIVDSDYQTAEVRGLAFISGDKGMIDRVTMPDKQFALLKGAHVADPADEDKVRLCFAEDSGIADEWKHPKLIMHRWEKYSPAEGETEDDLKQRDDIILGTGGVWKKLIPVTEDDLLEGEDGGFVHPRHDLHWELAEVVYQKPREFMHKKIERAAGKVGNFQSAYGASGANLDRTIEANTGKKPDPGTGDRLLEGIAKKQPVADMFLKEMELKPAEGKLVSPSGAIRHFKLHKDNIGLSFYEKNKIISPLSREARNYNLQNNVADTSARAAIWLTDHYKREGMKARVIFLLYDSIGTLCPLEERFKVAELHKKYMFEENGWDTKGGYLRYPIDTEFTYSWGESVSAEEAEKLNNPEYNGD